MSSPVVGRENSGRRWWWSDTGMDCEGFGGASIPQRSKEKDLRDLLSRYGLEVGVGKDVDQVAYEVISAFLQTVPAKETRQILDSVLRSVSTPSPHHIYRPFGGCGYSRQMSPIREHA